MGGNFERIISNWVITKVFKVKCAPNMRDWVYKMVIKGIANELCDPIELLKQFWDEFRSNLMPFNFKSLSLNVKSIEGIILGHHFKRVLGVT